MTPVTTSHIWLDDRGRPWIDDTNIKVIEVVLDMTAYGLSPKEIHDEHPGVFTMGQIHAALAYYYDHKAEIDAEIERQVREYEAARQAQKESPWYQKLREAGKVP